MGRGPARRKTCEEARHEDAQHAEAPREETRRDQPRREQTSPGRDEAGQAHGARPGWWAWPPGGSGWADPGTYRDLEQLARHFSRELRAAAAQAHAVSEDAVGDLRTILDDALDRIKAEVFGKPGATRPDAPRPDAARPDTPRETVSPEDGHGDRGDPGVPR